MNHIDSITRARVIRRALQENRFQASQTVSKKDNSIKNNKLNRNSEWIPHGLQRGFRGVFCGEAEIEVLSVAETVDAFSTWVILRLLVP